MSTISFLTTSKVYYAMTEADAETPSSLREGASITIKTSTTDANTRIQSSEVIVQPDPANNIDSQVTFVTVITTTDNDVVIGVTPTTSSHTINITTNGQEDRVDGKLITTITSVVTNTDSEIEVFASSETNDPSILTEPQYRYLILRHDLIDGMLHGNPGGDYNMTCQEMYSIFNIVCLKLSEGLYQTLKPSWVKEKIIELDEDTAFYGTTFFSEIRPVAKVWEARTTWYGEKVPTEITPEIQSKILIVMKAFATEIVNYEFERRFFTIRDSSDLEAASWVIQREEAKAFLVDNTAHTPFLDFLAVEKNSTKEYVANKIIENSTKYHDDLAALLIQEHTILDEFNSAETVWDINILYEDYFGITMPVSQAISLGRTMSDTDWSRKPEWRTKGNGYYF